MKYDERKWRPVVYAPGERHWYVARRIAGRKEVRQNKCGGCLRWRSFKTAQAAADAANQEASGD
ncbi:MAG: hypothetical protein Q8P46_06885 [Hyphomicrobiales bacterium]|nr:hypothetical protein [Hyphomicrobiales bacterium]